MSDNLTRYCAIRDTLMQRCPGKLNGHQRRSLCTLAQLVSGVAGSRKCQLPASASKAPCLMRDTQRDRRIKRFERLTRNAKNTQATFYTPYVQGLLDSLPQGPLALVMDTPCPPTRLHHAPSSRWSADVPGHISGR